MRERMLKNSTCSFINNHWLEMCSYYFPFVFVLLFGVTRWDFAFMYLWRYVPFLSLARTILHARVCRIVWTRPLASRWMNHWTALWTLTQVKNSCSENQSYFLWKRAKPFFSIGVLYVFVRLRAHWAWTVELFGPLVLLAARRPVCAQWCFDFSREALHHDCEPRSYGR